MANIRNKLEARFESLAHLIYKNRYKTLLIMALLIGALFSQVSKITLDTSTQGLLHKDDPYLIEYEEFREQFGRDQMVIILVNPPDVFNIDFLKKLKQFHTDLEENVPYLEDITSLINARNTRGNNEELIVEELVDKLPESQEELNAIKQLVFENPMFKNLLVSEDGKYTAIVIKTQNYATDENDIDVLEEFGNETDINSKHLTDPKEDTQKKFLSDKENTKMANTVYAIAEKYRSPDFKIYVAGSPILEAFLKSAMVKDMGKFMNLSLAAIALFLFIMFRRVSGVIMPILIVIMSLISTFSLMGIAGTPLKLPTQILPSFILAVGVGDAVHILVIFFHHFNKNGDKEDAIAYALGHSGLAVLMTSLTTAGGLLSFSTAEISPIADLGIFAACGVLIAFIYTVVLLPALLSIIPIKPKQNKNLSKETVTDRLLTSIGKISTNHPYKVLLVSSIIIFIAVLGFTRIRFFHNPIKWFPKDNINRIAAETIDQALRGSTNLEVIIDTGIENGLHNPDLLNRLDKSASYIEGLETKEVYAGKAWSFTTILKEINKALNENRDEFYSIPQNKKLIAQELLLFENSGSDDLEDVVDSEFKTARLTIKVPFVNAIAYDEFIKIVTEHFEKTYPDVNVTVTGMSPLMVRVTTSVIFSMAKSYSYALIIITILMVVLIGRIRFGLLSMIPNIAPILGMLGIMGWFDIRMDMFSMMVGSVAIGLAVDDTVHFMHNFRRYFEQSNDAKKAVMGTLHTTGRAMLVTTCVLSCGFFVFMFAEMNNLFYFGILTGVTIIMALISDYFIAPALMVVVNRKRVS